MTLRGIDVSDHQSTIAWDAVAGSGVVFAIVKATEGVGFRDTAFGRNWSEAKRVGLCRGAYHFARPDLGNGPTQEADYFAANLGQLDGGDFLALDYEMASVDGPRWCAAFLDRVQQLTDVVPLTYLNLSLARGHDWSPVLALGSGLWLALYDDDPAFIPATPWPLVAIKQYTSGGAVSGVRGRVDLDVFYGDLEQLRKYGRKPGMEIPQRMGQSADLQLVPGDLGTLQGIYSYTAHPEGRAIVWKVRGTVRGRHIITMYPPVDPDADATMVIAAEPCIFVVDILP